MLKQSFVCIKWNNLRSVVWGEAKAQDAFLASIQWAQNTISKLCISHYVYSETYELPNWQCQFIYVFEEMGMHYIPYVVSMVFLLVF